MGIRFGPTIGNFSARSARATRCTSTLRSHSWGSSRKYRGMARRLGVIDALEKCLKAAIFEDEEEAIRNTH